MISFLRHYFTRLSTRFSVLALISIVVMIVGGVISLQAFRDITGSFVKYANEDAPRLVALVELNGSLMTLGDTIRATETASTSAHQLFGDAITELDRAEQTYRSYREFGASNERATALLADKEAFLYALIEARDTYANASSTEEMRFTVTQRAKATYTAFAARIREAYIAEQKLQAASARTLEEGTMSTVISQYYTAVVNVVTTILTILFVYLFILQPLRDIRRTARDVARGNSDELANVAREDELGEVAHSFNAMLMRIRATQRAQDENATELKNTLTELAQMDKQTAQERAQFEQLLTSIADAVVVLDASSVVVLANEPARQFFGANIIGTSGNNICILSRIKNTENICEELLREAFSYTTPKIFEREYVITDTRGITIPVSITIATVRNRDNVVTNLILTFRDVTELVRLEEARVSFLSAASHQLRTPLSSMRWFLEMLEDGSLGEMNAQQKQAISDFSAGTLRMIDLVNVLLQFSRVEARRIAINPEPLELTELAREVAATLTKECLEKNIRIEVIADDVASVDADKQLIWQVILNFLTNAIRYGNEASTIDVYIQKQKDMFAVTVVNQGIGIPEVEQGRIFEKFYRASNAQRAVPNGNGIGLSLAKILIEDWGGTVSFTSVPNEKTTFTFTIPKKGMKKRKGEVSLQV